MNMKITSLLLICVLLAPGIPLSATEHHRIPDTEVRSISGRRGRLKDFIDKDKISLIALTAGQTQENGEEQLAALVSTHLQLLSEHPEIENTRILHLNVIAGAPFFVHGLIRRGLADSYSSPIRTEDVFVAFVSDAGQILDSFGITPDPWGTWIAVTNDGNVVWSIKDTGSDTAERIASWLQK
ncbi:hypothetical protein [Spirochaeta dissipatitropha]